MVNKLLGGLRLLMALALTAVSLARSEIFSIPLSVRLFSAAFCHVLVARLFKMEDTGSSHSTNDG